MKLAHEQYSGSVPFSSKNKAKIERITKIVAFPKAKK